MCICCEKGSTGALLKITYIHANWALRSLHAVLPCESLRKHIHKHIYATHNDRIHTYNLYLCADVMEVITALCLWTHLVSWGSWYS